jgi:hypothetical protein
VADLVSPLEFNDLLAVEGPLDGLDLASGCVHLYRDRRSVRGVELTLERGRFEVRVMTCATEDEYDLAIRLALSVAARVGQPCTTEEGVTLDAASRLESHGPDWIARNLESFRVVLGMVERGEGTVMLTGPVRPFHFGARMLAALRREADAGLRERFYALMRAVQYADVSRYHRANAMRTASRESGAARTFAVWGPDCAYLFPNVDHFAIAAPGRPLLVPREHLEALAGSRLRWLDECQALVDAVPVREWEQLVARARPRAAQL